jgi:hypothetical protein
MGPQVARGSPQAHRHLSRLIHYLQLKVLIVEHNDK